MSERLPDFGREGPDAFGDTLEDVTIPTAPASPVPPAPPSTGGTLLGHTFEALTMFFAAKSADALGHPSADLYAQRTIDAVRAVVRDLIAPPLPTLAPTPELPRVVIEAAVRRAIADGWGVDPTRVLVTAVAASAAGGWDVAACVQHERVPATLYRTHVAADGRVTSCAYAGTVRKPSPPPNCGGGTE